MVSYALAVHIERHPVVSDALARLPREWLARAMAILDESGVRLSTKSVQTYLPSQEPLSDRPAELGSFACRILLVGDQAASAENFTVGLRDFGHQIFLASSEPRQLIGHMGTCLPAVVIIQTAPGVSGFLAGCSLASCIRAVPYVPQPLIFISSSVEDGICRQEAQASGVDYFLRVASSCADIAQLVRQSILRPRRSFTTEQSASV
jgi:CheY-like chemotaxis protein